jgi:SAM-dependent methyltransferase
MLRVAKDHLAKAGMENVHFIQSSADHLPLAENSVSLLTCRIAPHHFPSVPGFLEEVGRVLEPQGHGVIIDSVVPAEEPVDRFINEVEFLRDPSHIRSYTLEQWLAFIEKSSLEIVSVELFERTHMFVEWAGRTGLDELEIKVVEHRFREASPDIRERLKVQLDERGRVLSYTDEKGTFVLKLGTG